MLPDPIFVTARVARVLEELEVPYYIGGSFASSVYGEPRSTNDVDFITELEIHHIEPLAQDLESEFYIDRLSAARAVEEKDCFNVLHWATMYRADIFVRSHRDGCEEAIQRRQLKQLGLEEDSPSAYFAGPEDTVLYKLYWYGLSGGVSDRQWKDILGVLKVQKGSLDMSYMQQQAEKMRIHELLSRALAESDRP